MSVNLLAVAQNGPLTSSNLQSDRRSDRCLISRVARVAFIALAFLVGRAQGELRSHSNLRTPEKSPQSAELKGDSRSISEVDLGLCVFPIFLPFCIASGLASGLAQKELKIQESFSPRDARCPNPLGGTNLIQMEALRNDVEVGDIRRIRMALKNRANPNGLIGTQYFIHIACQNDRMDIVRELLNRGVHINLRNKDGETPLEIAAKAGHVESCKWLIKNGADVNAHFKTSPLICACQKGRAEVVKLLLDSGANPNLVARISPLHAAIKYPHILEMLLVRGANIDSISDTVIPPGGQALHYAASRGLEQSVEILLKAGASAQVLDKFKQTPLDYAQSNLDSMRSGPSPIEAEVKRMERVVQKLEKASKR